MKEIDNKFNEFKKFDNKLDEVKNSLTENEKNYKNGIDLLNDKLK